MELSSIKNVPASVEDTYKALTDAQFLKDCIPGCESIEDTGTGRYLVTLAAKVGPVSARFNGSMTILDPEPPRAYTLVFEGKGGPAGFAKGSANVALAPDGAGGSTLSYTVKAEVGGKLAQVGARLIESAAKKVADEFFGAFITKMQARSAATALAEPALAVQGAGIAAATGTAAWKVAAICLAFVLLGWLVWSLR